MTRLPLTDLSGIDINKTPMNQFSVATANFGGIYTGQTGFWYPWSGLVDPDAVTLQVEAGARAIVLDIWPDPDDPIHPVVCAMRDMQSSGVILRSWKNYFGLSPGVGRYSNWDNVTINKRPVGDILKAAIGAAFDPNSPQQTDPFFVILRLHGAMKAAYLNNLGIIVQDQLKGHRMTSDWDKCNNQASVCSANIGTLASSAFVIVIPDIQKDMPITSYDDFKAALLASKLGEATNYLEQGANTVLFDPTGITQISAKNLTSPCGGASLQSLAQVGLCLVQPTIGSSTDNDTYYNGGNTFKNCVSSGAQFVAVNLFSPNKTDQSLTQFFDPAYFGKYSFRFSGPSS
jgi:hypothetical protein